MKAVFGILLILASCLWLGARTVNGIKFGIDCDGHLKRAADSNTIELATQEMRTAVQYLENKGYTSGYTSIIYRTPDEDVGFWYKNLKSSLQELETVSPQATQLEKSNVLMKLRETLLDEGSQGVSVTVPDGMGIFPNNTAYMLWCIFSLILCVCGVILICLQYMDH